MNGWAAVEEGKFTYDAATDSATLTITIEADVEFKVTVGPDWAIEFNAGTAIFNAEQFADNNGNIKFTEFTVYRMGSAYSDTVTPPYYGNTGNLGEQEVLYA